MSAQRLVQHVEHADPGPLVFVVHVADAARGDKTGANPGRWMFLHFPSQWVPPMLRTCPSYPQNFREKIVELAGNGRTLKELAEEFEPTLVPENIPT